ncbi:MAG: chromosome partitioning protein ParA [Zetaproteobacteria bacterium CG2_30_46_52]|nr:MAG: chromosome partitioning protein ParA [Zetaproteobacteria bacterium CG2_30_46_52]
MFSCLYEGVVRHRRYAPKVHRFENNLFYAFIDLDELDTVFKGRWLWSVGSWNLASFKRSDYLGDAHIPLKSAVLDCVETQTGKRPQGPVRLLTHLRYFGFVFNPVSFYYCYDEAGEFVEAIVAEITNTPWDERHAYVLPVSQSNAGDEKFQFAFDKEFHISPFMPMAMHYQWYFTAPAEHLTVHMVNFIGEDKVFDATLTMKKKVLNGKNSAMALIRFPLVTLKVVTLIYWHALLLWLKRVPFHDHPNDGHTKP